MSDILYFAYGSNLAEEKIRKVLGRKPESVPTRLRGYRLAFNKDSRNWTYAANVEPTPRCVVWGAAYKCTAGDMEKLDACEKGYHRVTVQVEGPDRNVLEAVTYIANAPVHHPDRCPKPEYLKLILDGAKEQKISRGYRRKVRLEAAKAGAQHG